MLTSCGDCNQNVSGTVLDKDTKAPIDSVYVHKDNKDYGEYTTDKGDFEISAISGGVFGCPLMTVVLNKDGYETTAVTIDNAASKTIYLTKKK